MPAVAVPLRLALAEPGDAALHWDLCFNDAALSSLTGSERREWAVGGHMTGLVERPPRARSGRCSPLTLQLLQTVQANPKRFLHTACFHIQA